MANFIHPPLPLPETWCGERGRCHLRVSEHFRSNHPAFRKPKVALGSVPTHVASPTPIDHNPFPSTPEPEPERRIDPADGSYYTKNDFIEFYGGLDQWEAAKSEPIVIELDLKQIREELSMFGESQCAEAERNEEGEYEVEEEILVLSDEWTKHFQRPKPKAGGKKKGKQVGSSRPPEPITTILEDNKVQETDVTVFKQKTPRRKRAAKQSGNAGVSKNVVRPVMRWADADEAGVYGTLEHQVRALEVRVKELAGDNWPVYPEAPLTDILD